jgi:hypothetical protein
MPNRDHLTYHLWRVLKHCSLLLQEQIERLEAMMLRTGEAKRPEGNIDVMINRPPF